MEKFTGRERPAVDEETSAALATAMSTLPQEAAGNFLKLPDAGPAGDAQSGTGYVVFNCAIRHGGLVPLRSADRVHPLWRDIVEAAGPRLAPGIGLLLRNHLVLSVDSGPDHPARIVAIADEAILATLPVVSRENPVTASELRILKQLLCGLNLSEAAAQDAVSHETKRTQFKSLCRKLGARSQNELTSVALTRILLNLSVGNAATVSSGDRLFIELAREFMPEARAFLLSGAAGADHRFLDIGPVDGRPVVFLHSQILPDLRPDDLAALHRHNIRLIVPLRNGAMASAFDRLDIEAHLDHACEGIDLARSHFCVERADILPCISGSVYGLEYARRYPDRVRTLAFVGACVKPNTGPATAGRLRAGMFALATRHWGLYSRVLEFYGRRIQRPDTLRKLLLNVYRPCLADLAVVKGEYAPPHGGERVRRLFSSSVESLKHDFYHQAHPRWETFPRSRFPTAFFHGTHDFIHSIGDVRDLAQSWGDVPIHPVNGAGQLLYHRHFEPMLAAYRAFLDQV